MDRRSSSRRYGVEIGPVALTTYDLDLIRSTANDILRTEHGFDVSRAWASATIRMLIKLGHLPNGDTNHLTDEKP